MPPAHAGRLTLLLALVLGGCQAAPPGEPAVALERLRLPPGFAIAEFARVPGARSLLAAEDGARIYVGTGGSEVYAILDPERDGVANEVVIVASGLRAPTGLALAPDGALLIAEQHRIIRLDRDRRATIVVPPGVLPDHDRHGRRYAALGPDGRVYVAVGAPCDVCLASSFEGTIVRLRPDAHELEIFARGVRDPGGFDWHPATGELFFTDQGGERPDDPLPPDELNRAAEPGLHFGFPYVHGDGVPDPRFADRPAPPPTTPPALAFEPGVAAQGIDFYTGAMFPADYRGDALVAQHGSRHGGEPAGYRIMRVRFSPAGQPQGKWVLIDGWLGQDGRVRGRPVDLEELPDGSLLISDDHAGVVYRVTYRPP